MADADLSGTVLDGRYQVIEPIAEGAMGSVYRGERLKLGRAVAIKIMHQELPDELASRQRFEREAKLMALLEHPNCVSVMDFGVHEDKPFLVMDLVRGTSLLELMDKTGPLDIARATDILKQVLSGLAHAHELGIVHRDIKPANIMISEKAGLGSQVRILDFGLARLTEGSTKLTTGIVVGTPNYMAPEQCKGSDIDARTDLYACGVLFFEMLTGRKPFIADDPIAVVRKHLLEKPPTLASVDPNINFGALEEVVAKALAKAPGDRYDSAVDMRSAVEAASQSVLKANAAALYARAVPDSKAPPMGSPQATPSGWSVPATADSGAVAAAPSGAADSSFAPAVTESQFVDAIAPPPGSPLAPQPRSPSTPVSAPNIPAASASSSGPSAISDGAPNRSLGIPPTRPAQAVRPSSQLPFSKKQLMIGGGGLIVATILIAVIAGHGGSSKSTSTTKTPTKTPVVQTQKPSEDDVAPTLERANKLIASDDPEAAVDLLSNARKSNPDNAQLALTLGRAYFGKLWWSEGVKNFRDAIKLDPELKSDPEMLKTVLKGFLTTPDVDDRIESFMVELGDPMKAYLKETAETHPNKQLRARAKSELRRFH